MKTDMRLIDANALLEKIVFRRPVTDFATKIVADCVEIARKDIVNAPTVDAVEVVRCKDCKWWDGMDYCTNVNGANGLVFNGEWFCASGERREGE